MVRLDSFMVTGTDGNLYHYLCFCYVDSSFSFKDCLIILRESESVGVVYGRIRNRAIVFEHEFQKLFDGYPDVIINIGGGVYSVGGDGILVEYVGR